MPSKAGRVRMPADNRLPVSASLKTSEIWKNSVGYDPYASIEELNNKELKKNESRNEEINEKAKSLFNLAVLTGTSSTTIPGACTLCNHIGHLPYQCRNFITIEELNFQRDIKEEAEDDLKERKNLGIVSSSDSGSESGSESGSNSGSGSDSGSDAYVKRRRREKHKKKKHKLEKRRDKHEERRKHKREERRKHKHEERRRHKLGGKMERENDHHSSKKHSKLNMNEKEKRKKRTRERGNEGGERKRHRKRSFSN
ncbi:hypothetical protein, conserved [Plasmodium gonderi]|uniref:Uncharacterized protein n=1 Tax=Plasmodium gonderi TaxID=77519 RepID=A0A1Y1JG25_PLAGO|nr:hypothetical protein, conserved [Plasmodium gonderi]GAW81469.1 hypothetical protein, conserved [Plasmodium gonderi]